MNPCWRNIIAVFVTGLWVNASEFFRNEILLKRHWVGHYQSLGMIYPSAPVNGMTWILWGFLFALSIFLLSRKFSLVQTSLLGWFMGFVLMWIVTLNLNILPHAILMYAVPLSLLEAFIGAYLCTKISPQT